MKKDKEKEEGRRKRGENIEGKGERKNPVGNINTERNDEQNETEKGKKNL